jgi:hypothetical protein
VIIACGGLLLLASVTYAFVSSQPSLLPTPAYRISDEARQLLAELRVLQRRAQALADREAAEVGVLREAMLDYRESVPGRVDELEAQVASLLAFKGADRGSPGATGAAVEMYAAILERGDVPIETRTVVYDRLASIPGATAFMTRSIANNWLSDAHALGGQAALRGHLVNARHLAPHDDSVRAYLVTTLVMEKDEDLREAAMLGLVHCIWNPEVKQAMRDTVDLPGSTGLRRSALSWLHSTASSEKPR